MLGLKDLRSHTKADVAGLLDAAVNIDIAVVDDEEKQVGLRRIPRICQLEYLEGLQTPL